MSFKDHFSDHADLYAQSRPHYPDTLFAWIAETAPARRCVWDVGCGNGQASMALARHFEYVIATDPSAQQISNAVAEPRVEYRVEPRSFPTTDGAETRDTPSAAYRTTIPDHSVDTVTIAQALHWFDLAAFVAEVERVARPGALFAAWCYANCSVIPAVDAIVARLYDDTLGAYWSPERRLVDEGYAPLDIPFTPVAAPAFEMCVDWDAPQLLAYLSSWSAAQHYLQTTGNDAIAAITGELIAAWGDAEQVRPVRWTLGMRAGRVM